MIKMKTCAKCTQEKPLDGFSKDKTRVNGYNYLCKSCVREYRQTPVGKKVAARAQKKYQATPNGGRIRKRYVQSSAGKTASARAMRKYRATHSERRKAKNILHNAIRAGRITHQPCIICASMENIHAHHGDYSQPLSAVWLCRKHHCEHHRAERAFANS